MFHPTTEANLPLLHEWLNEPGVVRWWEGDDVSWPAVQRDYGPDRDDGTRQYVALYAGEPVGWIQWFRVADSTEELQAWQPFGITGSDIGIDYLLGRSDQRGQGLGQFMIGQFVAQVVRAQTDVGVLVCASPVEANYASVGALARAGFAERGRFVDPESGPCVLMVHELG